MNETPTVWRVDAPSLTLYAFHPRHDITKGSQQAIDNANQLWEQCVAFGEQRDIVILKSLKEELRSYTYNSIDRQFHYTPANEDIEATDVEKPFLNDWLELARRKPKSYKARHLRFHVETRHLPTAQNVLLLGELYPLRIQDSYAVDLTLRYRHTADIPQLHLLNPTDVINASLGQTLLLFAKPVDVPESAYQDLANQCVAALLGKNTNGQNSSFQIQPSAKGQLFGSPIFEYDNYKENPTERRHILVWLDTHPNTLNCVEQRAFYHTLLNLLYCRSKILYTYYQSRLRDSAAREIYSDLEAQINRLATRSPDTLAELKQWLKQTPLRVLEYGKLIRDLEDYENAIATHIKNYRSSFDKIHSICVDWDDLEFLENFLNSTSQQFQAQIQLDLRYLTPALELFQQTIDTILGIVEIEAEEQRQAREQEKEKRDRNLQDTIECVGVGIGAASIVASTSSYLTQNGQVSIPFTDYSINPFTFSLLLSILAAGVSAAATWWISGLMNPRSDREAKIEGHTNSKLQKQTRLSALRQVTRSQHKTKIPTQLPRK